MLTLYINDKMIKAAEGKKSGKTIAVRKLCEIRELENCLQNGSVADEETYIRIIASFWKENVLPKKDVALVIESNQFVTKQVELPQMKKKNTDTFIKNEFASVERMTDPVFAYEELYTPKDKTKTKTVFAAACEREFLSAHAEAFEKCGIRIISVRPSLSAAIAMLNTLSQIRSKSCVVQLFGEGEVTNVLFVDGIYKYSSKTRLFEQKGTPSFAAEVSRSINNILQFVRASFSDTNITDVFICGITDKDLSICKEAIEIVSPALIVSELDMTSALSISPAYEEDKYGYFYSVAALNPSVKDTDFSAHIKSASKYQPIIREAAKYAKPVVICFGILAFVLLSMAGYRLVIRMKINKVYDYTKDPAIIAKCDEYDALQSEIDTLQGYLTALSTTEENNASYPAPGSIIKNVLTRCASGLTNVSITDYSASAGIIKFDCTATEVELINQFIKLLKQEKSFYNITYTGYSYNENEDSWAVNVVCYLSETAGKPEEVQ